MARCSHMDLSSPAGPQRLGAEVHVESEHPEEPQDASRWAYTLPNPGSFVGVLAGWVGLACREEAVEVSQPAVDRMLADLKPESNSAIGLTLQLLIMPFAAPKMFQCFLFIHLRLHVYILWKFLLVIVKRVRQTDRRTDRENRKGEEKSLSYFCVNSGDAK